MDNVVATSCYQLRSVFPPLETVALAMMLAASEGEVGAFWNHFMQNLSHGKLVTLAPKEWSQISWTISTLALW